MANDINTLRDNLFETLAALKDKDNPMALDRARAISEVAQTIINSAKVEVDFIKHARGKSISGFIENQGDSNSDISGPQVIKDDRTGKTTVEMVNGARITRHITR
ncbi:MAG: hypothetical protein KGI54_15060 [Pseudomonadota bacterium]|nr:hypothetical protein [Pseudomonadota bacterium]